MKIKEQADKFLNTPWLRFQLESHLVLRLFVNDIALSLVVSAIFSLSLISTIITTKLTLLSTFSLAIDYFYYLLIIVILFKLTRYQQAAIAWILMKSVGALLSFILILFSMINFVKGMRADALIMLGLGLIWMPSIEFIPKITPKQKYITIARIILSIPLIVLGIQGGSWHWK